MFNLLKVGAAALAKVFTDVLKEVTAHNIRGGTPPRRHRVRLDPRRQAAGSRVCKLSLGPARLFRGQRP